MLCDKVANVLLSLNVNIDMIAERLRCSGNEESILNFCPKKNNLN